MTAAVGTARAPIAGSFRAPPVGRRVIRLALPLPSEGALVTGASLGIYLAAAAVLAFAMQSVEGDAWSRVGNAYYMLFSRDPHLAAIGFVWSPLPSLAVAPLLPLKALWPPLVSAGFAGNIVSAVCMAGCVYQVRVILRDLGVGRLTALALTGLFALHPMVVLYGANGMSEAMFMLFSLLAVRHLVRWVESRQSASLVHAGVALALVYLTRYEGIAIAGGAILFVLLCTFLSAASGIGTRVAAAVADVLIVSMPFAFALGMWAFTSWIIVGSPFETFTSIYGATSQLNMNVEGIREATGQGTWAGIDYLARQFGGLEPALAFGAAVLVAALVRRNPRLLVPVAVLGAGLAFSVWTFVTGRSFGWLRFYILVIPLVIFAAGATLAVVREAGAVTLRRRMAANRLISALVVTLVALGLPGGLLAMQDPGLGREETDKVRWVVGSSEPLTDGTVIRQAQQSAALDLARYLDDLALPAGAVLIDVATGYPVVLQSERPAQFVITPDRDFQAAVADPVAFDIRYAVVAPPYGYESLNAIERAHPGIYATGANLAVLVADFGSGVSSWRLYRFKGVP